MENKLVICDMDGVISDTQKYHAQAEIEILKQYGIITIEPTSNISITTDWISSNFSGVQPKERMYKLFTIHSKEKEFDIHTIEQQKNDALLELYNNGTVINYITGANEILGELFADETIKVAVVTASTRDCMIFVLSTLDIKDKFDDIVSIYDIDPTTNMPYPSKGMPDIYERLKNKYGVDVFIMIEDGETGMNGAIKAGGHAIAILGENKSEKFPNAITHHKDLSTLYPSEIKRILS